MVKIRINESQLRLLQEQSLKYTAGCLMLELDRAFGTKWDEFLSEIDSEDVYKPGDDSYGLSKEPHCTVLFGFTEETDLEKLKEFLESYKEPFNLRIKSKTLFEQSDYEVLKFDVECSELVTLNAELVAKFPNKQTFKDYHPHITLAYIKKGEGEKYIDNDINLSLSGSYFKYSDSVNKDGIFYNK